MVKLGLGDSYDKVVVPPKIRAYADITKPASSIGVMATIPFSTIIYGELYHTSGIGFLLSHWLTVIYASVTMFLLHGASQAMNMAEDAYIDKQTAHKQNRPIPSGVITENEARALAWIFVFVGIARAFTISTSFGGYALLLSFFGIFYNLEPLRVKQYLWINLIWQAASRGLFLFPATFAIWEKPWDKTAWVLGVASFLLVLAMQNTADFADADIDEKFGITTPAVHHGLNQLTIIMCGIALMMFGFIGLANLFDLLPNLWSLYMLAIPIGWSLWSLWTEPNSIAELGGNHLSWYVFYFSLASMYMLPAIQLTFF